MPSIIDACSRIDLGPAEWLGADFGEEGRMQAGDSRDSREQFVSDGTATAWYKNGLLHREGGPAVVDARGNQFWYFEGLLHRTDGPAAIRTNDTREWFLRGKRHRDGDLPAIVYRPGTVVWRTERANSPPAAPGDARGKSRSYGFGRAPDYLNCFNPQEHDVAYMDWKVPAVPKYTPIREIDNIKESYDVRLHEVRVGLAILDSRPISFYSGRRAVSYVTAYGVTYQIIQDDRCNGGLCVNTRHCGPNDCACRRVRYVRGEKDDRSIHLGWEEKGERDTVYHSFRGVPCETSEWYWHGKLHRSDAPAHVSADGSYKWARHGKLNRFGAPAVYRAEPYADPLHEFSHEWHWNGSLHRAGGPAATGADGIEVWARNGLAHRAPDEGPALNLPVRYISVMGVFVTLGRYTVRVRRGVVHCERYPAVVEELTFGAVPIEESYFNRGVLHRDDGPAKRYCVYNRWLRTMVEFVADYALGQRTSYRHIQHSFEPTYNMTKSAR
jgi:hypothetical protein